MQIHYMAGNEVTAKQILPRTKETMGYYTITNIYGRPAEENLERIRVGPRIYNANTFTITRRKYFQAT